MDGIKSEACTAGLSVAKKSTPFSENAAAHYRAFLAWSVTAPFRDALDFRIGDEGRVEDDRLLATPGKHQKVRIDFAI